MQANNSVFKILTAWVVLFVNSERIASVEVALELGVGIGAEEEEEVLGDDIDEAEEEGKYC